MSEAPPIDDPLIELAELTASLRAHLAWQAETGASGLPPSIGEPTPVASHAIAVDPIPTSHEARAPEPEARASIDVGRDSASAGRSIDVGRDSASAGRSIAAEPQAPSAAQPRLSIEDVRTRLALLAEEARTCSRCGLCKGRQQAVFSRGDPSTELCFVGEGPGADEDRLGEPFVGAAGQLLDKMIVAMGYHRDAVYICNIVKCRPPENRKPEPDEMKACLPFVTQQIDLVRPKVIVALGATAMQGLFGTTLGITRLRGTWKVYKTIPVMPTFHPAYLLRNPAAKREVWSDLQEVMKRLNKPLPRPARG